MTSELRPAVETRAEVLDQLLSELQDGDAWDSTISLLADYADLVQDLLKDREAVRAEQAAEIERLKSHLEDAKEIIQKQIKQAAELAKFKALAETLAKAGEDLKADMIRRAEWAAARRKDDDIVVEAGAGVWFRFNEALRQYKEARDAN